MKMSKLFYLLTVLFLYSKCFEVPPQLKPICPQGCKRYFYCDEQQKKCVYKGFFPIYPLEFIEILCFKLLLTKLNIIISFSLP